jgi:hypothetical protein
MAFPKVKIEMVGAAVGGGHTKIFVDGELQDKVSRAVLTLEVGSLATLTLDTFVECVFDGEADVEVVHVCPECKHALQKNLSDGECAIVETTRIGDSWVRKVPVRQ